MTIHAYADPLEFWAVAQPVAEAEPVLHSVMATVTDSTIREPSLYPDRIFYVVEREGRLPFLAHHTPPYPILVLTCALYTDLANPTSNGIYQAIGYRHLGDTADLAFVAAEA